MTSTGCGPRTIAMSPLTLFRRSFASLPAPVDCGASVTSSAELTSPLVALASMKTRVPGATPTWMSPETDCSLISPWRIERMCWSPETVFASRPA